MRRAAANFEEHPKGSGRYRVRARIGGKLKTVASGLPEAEAEGVANAYQDVKNTSELREGVTVAAFGKAFLDRRERAGVRGVKKDRYSWGKHVEKGSLGPLALSTLARRDVLDWVDGLSGLAHRTRVRVLNLLRVALDEAVDRELLETNPAREVRVHRSSAARATDDLEGILTPAEQQALVVAVPEHERATVVFALCTGLRQAEQWWLRWEDLLGERIIVRRSAGGLPPKNGKPRDVPLLPAAIAAIASLPRRSEWVFPALHGGRRDQGKPARGWKKWLEAAGIKRNVRWHDLRHTCATSLLAGWWSPKGERWSLDAVCKLLGHSSVQVTERYARKLDSTLLDAVAKTEGPKFPTGNGGGGNGSKPHALPVAFVKRRSSVQIRKSAQVVSSLGWELDGNTKRELRLLKLADIDPAAARPGLAFCRAHEAAFRLAAGDEKAQATIDSALAEVMESLEAEHG